MKQISFNQVAKLCLNINEPLYITPDGENNLILMNEDTFDEYFKAKQINEVLDGIEQLEQGKVIDGELAFKQVKETYGYKL